VKAAQRVALAVDPGVEVAERSPRGDLDPELLLDLSPRRLARSLAPAHAAARELPPLPRSVGVAHEQHLVTAGDHALRSALDRPREHPVDLQHAIGEAKAEPAERDGDALHA